MGNSQSTSSSPAPAPVEQVIRPQEPGTSVQFSPSLLHQLTSSSSSSSDSQTSSSSSSSSPSPSASHHDPAILSRLSSEISRLKSDEAQIISQITSALEKENLDKDRDGKGGLNAVLLSRDLEEVREKVERMGRKGVEMGGEEVGGTRRELVMCYKNNPERPLDCYHQVSNFKSIVGKIEQDFVASLR